MSSPARAAGFALAAILAIAGLVLLTRSSNDGGDGAVVDEPDGGEEAAPPFRLSDADRGGAVFVDERRGVVLGIDAKSRVVWRDRAAYATFGGASCLARCPDAVVSGAPWERTRS